MQWQQRIVFRPETAHYSSLVKNKQHCTSSAPGLPPDRRSLQMRLESHCIVYIGLPATSPPETNQQRSFHAHFLSDAVTTEFPSPGDDRIQFHAVSLLEASIFTKAVSKQRVLATDAFRLLCSPPSISLGNSPAKARQQAHTQHTKKRIASRVCSECRIKLSFWVDLEVVDGGRRGICLMERGFKKERMAVQLSFVNV